MSDDIVGEEVTATPEAPTMEKLTAAVVTVLGLAMLIGARGIVLRNEVGGVDARWWPTVIAAGIIACGLWMTFNAFRGVSIERTVDQSSRQGWIQVGITVGALALVLVLWHVGVGFLVLGPLYLVGMNWVYGLRRWTTLLLFPAIIMGLLYLIFMLLLKVPL
ncbi:MAG: tripartite tricarboxylate transporter TctB family protein [Arachnia sp.]